MRPLLLAMLPLVALATPLMAQEVPEAAQKDLWCGLAFSLVVKEAPAEPGIDPAMVQRLTDGGKILLDRATAAHLELGYTDESFAAHRTTMEEQVRAEIDASGAQARFSFEDCEALLS